MVRVVGFILVTVLAAGCDTSDEPTEGSPRSSVDPLELPPRVDAAFVNANVIAMDEERVISGQTVIVEDGTVTWIGPQLDANVPTGAMVIDGTNRYLMPGLIDNHVHLWDANDLVLFLANGVTTVRDMNGSARELIWRREIAAGRRLGPRLYVSSPIIDGDPPVFAGNIAVGTTEKAVAVVRDAASAGYDFIKVYGALTVPVYDALVGAANEVGLKIVGHVPNRVSLLHALEMGHYSIEHLYGYVNVLESSSSPIAGTASGRRLYGAVDIDAERLPELVAETKAAGAWNCPTLIVLDRWVPANEAALLLGLPQMRFASPQKLADWNPATNFLAAGAYLRDSSPELRALGRSVRRQLVKGLWDGGAGVVLGTDSGSLYVQAGFSIHTELQNLIEAGLSPYEALRTGTSDAAVFLDGLDIFGTVEVGKRADLVLLEDNPLEDIAHTQDRVGVMRDGRWLSEQSIQERLDAVARAYGR